MGPLGVVHLVAGAALVLAAWLVPRRLAGARRAAPIVLLIDFAPLALAAGLLALAAGRPLFAGVIVLALGAGFTLADYTMRQTLREPVVFSEAVELPQVFTHPHLYLPFAGPGLVLGGAAAAAAAAAALLVVEAPLWQPRPLLAAAGIALLAAGIRLASREPLLAIVGDATRRLAPSGEPFADAAALGPFAMLFAHTVIARAERGARQRALAPPAILQRRGEPGGPVIIVQCESFFDARRLSPLVPRELLAGFDACCAAAAMSGRIEVPGWGANTMRSEFAVLTGISEAALGYDRFNPYYALARAPIESQVWRLRRAGYRTFCLHPFDRRFFRRDLVMPALGFEQFLGRESIGGTRSPPYCPDPELARQILATLDREGPQIFIFAITMGNHGPWVAKGPPLDPSIARLYDATDIPGGAGLLRYLDGMRRSDEMLQLLVDGLKRRDLGATLAFYGDHLPSLPLAFTHFGFTENSSDFVVWPGGVAPQRRDLPAHELGRLVVDGVLAAAPPSAGAHGACLTPRESASLAE
jgi:hypothetical protein